jgi:prepilin-type N-terminal cleavage/methylation domain-containing protein
MQRLVSRMRTRKGFTLVELAVVIVIIGLLAAFGVPKFLNSVEKAKASEGFNYLSTVQAAQERYLAQNGAYATAIGSLDLTMPPPQYFDPPSTIGTTPSSAGAPAWTLTLTRNGSSSYAYTIIWTQDGFSSSSSISTYPQICPITVASGSSGS